MTSSLAALANAGPPRTIKGPPCSVGALLDRLDPDERAGLEKMLRPKIGTRGWDSEQIHEAILESHGEDIAGQTIARHRRGGCKNCVTR